MLLAYIWGDEIVFRANKVDDRQRTPRVFRGWKETLGFSAAPPDWSFSASPGSIRQYSDPARLDRRFRVTLRFF